MDKNSNNCRGVHKHSRHSRHSRYTYTYLSHMLVGFITFKRLSPFLNSMLSLTVAAGIGLGLISCSPDHIDPKVKNYSELSVADFATKQDSSNITGLYQVLKEALRYQKLQDFASAIRLYEKVLLTLDSPTPIKAVSVEEQKELFNAFGNFNQLAGFSSTLLLPLVHYNLAHALYQHYLNILTESSSPQLHADGTNKSTDETSFYLARAVYYYNRIIHTPPYSRTYSPLLIELSSNNLTAIQQRHRIPFFTPELSIIERINLSLVSLATSVLTPHLLGISFLVLLTLGMIWMFLQNKYPRIISHRGKIANENGKSKNFFHNGFNQLRKLGKWKNIFNQTTSSSETSEFYLSGYDHKPINTALPSKDISSANLSNLAGSLAGSSAAQSLESVPPLVKKIIIIVRTWFFICLFLYVGLGLMLWYSSSEFLVNSVNDFKNLFNLTLNTSTISKDTLFNELAVIRAQTSLRDNPTQSARPLTSLVPGEVIGIKTEAKVSSAISTPNALQTTWRLAKTANGLIGWMSQEHLLFIKSKD